MELFQSQRFSPNSQDAIEDLMEENSLTRGDKSIDDHMLTIPNYSDKEIARARYHTRQRRTKKQAVDDLKDAFLAEHKKNNYENLANPELKKDFD